MSKKKELSEKLFEEFGWKEQVKGWMTLALIVFGIIGVVMICMDFWSWVLGWF